MDALDRWALHQTARLLADCTQAYDAFEFHRVYQLCNQFCAVTLSAVYHDILKDRLYTLGATHPLRRSSQTALHHIFRTLVRVLAPVLTFTADEAWSFATAGREFADDSVHLQDWPEAPAEWTDAALDAGFGHLLALRTRVNEAVEPKRAAKQIGKSLDVVVSVAGTPGEPAYDALVRHRDSLAEFFIVSQVDLAVSAVGGPPALAVQVAAEAGLVRCPRCWRWVPALTSTAHGEVCPRCADALNL
jgi:isoleucyl-tRNA synthetase